MPAGRSILEMLWERLDKLTAELLAERDKPMPKEARALLMGNAQGLSTAIAVMMNPYRVDVDAVRTEAMRRYEGAQSAAK